MSLKVIVEDGSGTGKTAHVNEQGGLVVTERYNVVAFSALTSSAADTLIEPEPGKSIVINSIVVNADRSVTSQSLVDVYLASGINSATIDQTILKLEVPKSTTIAVDKINFIVDEGVWVNTKADDQNVNVTVFYYYV